MLDVDGSVLRMNAPVMAIDPNLNPELHPKLHLGIYPLLITMRQELKYMERINRHQRKINMRKLLEDDYLSEDLQLRQVGLAYYKNHC